MGNQNMERDKNPQPGQRRQDEGRKDHQEPIQLPDDKSKSGQQQPQRPGMGRESEQHGGQHQGGGQHGGGQKPAAK